MHVWLRLHQLYQSNRLTFIFLTSKNHYIIQLRSDLDKQLETEVQPCNINPYYKVWTKRSVVKLGTLDT